MCLASGIVQRSHHALSSIVGTGEPGIFPYNVCRYFKKQRYANAGDKKVVIFCCIPTTIHICYLSNLHPREGGNSQRKVFSPFLHVDVSW